MKTESDRLSREDKLCWYWMPSGNPCGQAESTHHAAHDFLPAPASSPRPEKCPMTEGLSREEFEKLTGDILNQVVCACGNYKHHGVDWMPEGSGEGLSSVMAILNHVYGLGYAAASLKQAESLTSNHCGHCTCACTVCDRCGI